MVNSPYLNRPGEIPPNHDFRETEQPPSYRILMDYEVLNPITRPNILRDTWRANGEELRKRILLRCHLTQNAKSFFA